MEKPRVYIETTIPSAYYDLRTAPEMVRRREVTRQWWSAARDRCEMVTSLLVHEELGKGPSNRKAEWIRLIERLPILEVVPALGAIVSAYHRHKLMPKDDALHLALASSYRCDYLITWNFKHLANPNKFGHIQRVNDGLDLFVPRIVTPFLLPGEGP